MEGVEHRLLCVQAVLETWGVSCRSGRVAVGVDDSSPSRWSPDADQVEGGGFAKPEEAEQRHNGAWLSALRALRADNHAPSRIIAIFTHAEHQYVVIQLLPVALVDVAARSQAHDLLGFPLFV